MYEQLKEILATKFQIEPDQIGSTSTLKELELDSLDVVELALVIEKELGAAITDDELFEAQRLDAIVDLAVARKETTV